MTAPTLQSQLRLLAEKARMEFRLVGGKLLWRDVDSMRAPKEFPICKDNRLTDAEYWTVLGWLAKAGYMPQVDGTVDLNKEWKTEQPIDEMFGEHSGYMVNLYDKPPLDVPAWIGTGKSPEAALTAAVLKLPLEAEPSRNPQ